MSTLKTTLISLATAVPMLAFSLSSEAAMDPKVENALISVCKSVMSNKMHKYRSTTKAYHLKDKVIALKVMCNGEDIITFAESHQADKIAARLQKSIGNVSITDTEVIAKLNVTFTE